MSDEAEDTKQYEATYFSVLGLLDELPSHEQRVLVALNWVKYVMLTQADASSRGMGSVAIAKFRLLCLEFAFRVADLPDMLDEETERVCTCDRCVERRASAERPTEPAPRDETVN